MPSNSEIIQEIYDEFEKGDFDKALSRVSDDIIWTERIPFAGTTIGDKAEIKAMFARVGETLDWNMDFDHMVAIADKSVELMMNENPRDTL